MGKHSKAKYRPVLPDYLIAHILELAKKEAGGVSEYSYELIGILAPFKAKIDNLAIAPVYTTTDPKLEQFESLGGTVVDAAMPKEEYWQLMYEKYQIAPQDCTLKEIEAANEHAYLQHLMSDADMEAFEKGTTLCQPQAD